MLQNFDLSTEQLFDEAQKKLNQQDLLDFVATISIVIDRAKDNQELLAKATHLKIKGLMNLGQYTKLLENAEEALKLNDGIAALEIKKYKAVAKGYLGEIQQAASIFEELLTATDHVGFLVGVYINLSWLYLLECMNKNFQNLEKVKYYLDLAQVHFDDISDARKVVINQNYSVYYYHTGKFEKAIEILENTFQYCEERQLSMLYNNLAEHYIKLSEDELYEQVDGYLKKAEVIGLRYKNNFDLGNTFYTKALAEIKDQQLFSALDTLYLAFEYFKAAEAYPYAFDCMIKMNELMNDYKIECLTALKGNMKDRFKGTAFFNKF